MMETKVGTIIYTQTEGIATEVEGGGTEIGACCFSEK
jgi:hypothetical protein